MLLVDADDAVELADDAVDPALAGGKNPGVTRRVLRMPWRGRFMCPLAVAGLLDIDKTFTTARHR